MASHMKDSLCTTAANPVVNSLFGTAPTRPTSNDSSPFPFHFSKPVAVAVVVVVVE